ncbi:MAG: glycosyltransferase family 2 protein, partial [Ornithinimicrobium sp.]
MKISLVVPCHNEEGNLAALYEECCLALREEPGAEWEMILVDDGSSDSTAEIARKLAREHERIRAISLSRNFGKEAAMLAGLRLAAGNVTVILDADLQHPPRLIPQMVERLQSTPDVHQVVARRNRAGDSRRNALAARLYYRLV